MEIEADVRVVKELQGPSHPMHGLVGDVAGPFEIVSSRRDRGMITSVPLANNVGAPGRNR